MVKVLTAWDFGEPHPPCYENAKRLSSGIIVPFYETSVIIYSMENAKCNDFNNLAGFHAHA